MSSNYSEDETLALLVSAALALISWGAWYYQLAAVRSPVRQQGLRWPLSLAPLACALLLYIVLQLWSAEDVRDDPDYVLFYMVIGAGWVGLFRVVLPGRFGLNPRDDALERGNSATSWATAGALIGGTCCFAGGNVGNGPGWWVVLFSGALATGSLLFLWWILHLAVDLPEKIAVERDQSAGIRAAGFLIGAGIILGRAAAGDWVSAADTLTDFGKMAWPALMLALAAMVVEKANPPDTLANSGTTFLRGFFPAAFYVAAGGLLLLLSRSS